MTRPPLVGSDHLVFRVDDMPRAPFDPSALRQHLKAHGVAIEREATHAGARGMGFSACIRDPFGSLREIKEPADYPDGRPQ